jgi:hypothetical protein
VNSKNISKYAVVKIEHIMQGVSVYKVAANSLCAEKGREVSGHT